MSSLQIVLKLASYSHLVIILLALIFNTLTFVVFRCTKEFQRKSSMVYLSFIVVLDAAVLFTFNLNQFLLPNFGIQLENFNLVSCRLVSFFIFFLCMSIGFLYTFISIDRLVTIYSIPGSFFKKLPFSTAKSASGWSIGLIGISFIINCPLLIVNGYYVKVPFDLNQSNQSTNDSLSQTQLICYADAYSPSFNLFSLYSNLTLIFFCIIPFILTSICDFFIIKLTFKKNHLDAKSARERIKIKKKKQMTISLIIITCLFLFMSLPLLCLYGFYDYFLKFPSTPVVQVFLSVLHSMSHASVFFSSWCTFPKFRTALKSLFFKTESTFYSSTIMK